MKKFLNKIFYNSWVVVFGSAIWFLARSGLKPTRMVYPCQQIAKNNLAIFGLPAFLLLLQRFKKCPTFRKKAVVIFLLVFFIGGSFLGISKFKKYQTFKTFNLIKQISGQNGQSRVIWITNDQATNDIGYTQPWENKASQATVDNMMGEAIKALTNAPIANQDWTILFEDFNEKNGRGRRDYQSGETIAVKLNFNNSPYCGDHSSGCPIYQVTNALLKQLVDKGIAQEDIGLYDTSRSFPDYFIQGVTQSFPNVKLNPDQQSPYLPYNPCVVSDSVRGAFFGCWLANADYLINMPLLRTHGTPAVTLSFKNHLGSMGPSGSGCPGPACFHGAFMEPTPDTNSLVQLNRHPIIKDKTFLIISDAIYGLSGSGPAGYPNLEPKSLFLSTDPVAVDSVMIDYLESIKGGWGSRTPRVPYQLAANIGLGNFATSCAPEGSCTFTYNNIDLVRCDPNCSTSPPGPTNTPLPTSTSSPLPTDIDQDGMVNIQDAINVLSAWLSGGSSGYDYREDVNGDQKVNAIDLGFVIKDWGKTW